MPNAQNVARKVFPEGNPGLMALYKLGLRAAATDTYRSAPPHWSNSARAAYIRGYRDGLDNRKH